MHELLKYGLFKIRDGSWEETEKYQNIQLRLKDLMLAIDQGCSSDWFLDYVNSLFSGQSMVRYAYVKEHLNLIGLDITEIANDAFFEKGGKEKPLDRMKTCLEGLYDRRNVIAHQLDRRHADARQDEISENLVHKFMSDLEKIVLAIFKIVKKRLFTDS